MGRSNTPLLTTGSVFDDAVGGLVALGLPVRIGPLTNILLVLLTVVALTLAFQPGLKTAGTIYNASESNSMAINRQAKAEAERRGIKWVEATVTGSADVKTTAASLLGKVDAFVLGQDNTVASAFEAVVKTAQDNRLPIFSMDPQAPARGAVASLAAGQYAQGVLWATELAAPILLGADPGKVAPIRPRVFDLQVNVVSATAVGLTIPKDILDKASRAHGR
jgi:putative ABC transport system substrate-binding protein